MKFRSEASLPREARAIALDAGIDGLSTILRGAILTVDVMLAAPKERAAMEHDLRLRQRDLDRGLAVPQQNTPVAIRQGYFVARSLCSE